MGDIKVVELNRVSVSGRLTRDIELRYIPSGTAVAALSLAVNTSYYSKEKGRQEKTCFIGVTVWGRQAETASEYLKKGNPVLITGELESEEWETQDGQKRQRVKIRADHVQFLEWPDEKKPSGQQQEKPAAASADDDDVPF